MVRCVSLLGLIVVSLLVSSRGVGADEPAAARGCLPSPRRPPTGRLPAAGLRAAGLPAAGLRAAGLSPARRLRAPHLGGAPPPPPEHPRRVFSLTISPIHLFLPVVELTGEARVHDKVGIALIAGAGKYTDPNVTGISATVYEAGGQVRVYVIGDFRHGMQLGGELLYLHLNDDRIAISGEGLAVGPFLGYKIMIDAGFTFDCPARLRAHQRAGAAATARRPATSRSSRF